MKKASSRPAGTGWRSGLASGGVITAILLGAAIARADDDVSKGDKLAMSPEAHIVTNDHRRVHTRSALRLHL